MRLVLISIILLTLSSFNGVAQTLIMNEVSNGASGNQEYVEFIVVDTAVIYDCSSSTPPCIDIRGWIFDDNSGYHGTAGIAAGCVRFSFDPLWSCIPLGTIIVVYNDADPNSQMPPVDITMADNNCAIVAPIGNTSLFESNATTPGDVACSYPTTGWTPGGNWNNTLLANGGDCARIVDLNGCEVFSVCWDDDNQNNVIYFPGGATSGSSAANTVYYFTDGDPTSQANWTVGCADPADCGQQEQTPGAPNNPLNAQYIGQFNNSCNAITPLVASAVVDMNASCICDGQATASGSGSIPGYTYVWYDDTYTAIGQTSATATGLCGGTYHVVVTSSIGCEDTATVTLTSAASGTVTVNSEEICEGESATLTATPNVAGGTYLWSPNGETTASITVSPTSTTTYTVDYTLNGCTNSEDAIVTVHPNYAITESIDACENSTVTYPDGTSATVTTNTSYTSSLQTINGCDSIITTNVTVLPIFSTSETLTACENSTVTYPDGSTATITSNTTYTSNLVAVNGCDSTVVTTVQMNPVYSSTENITLCSGSNYTFPDGFTASNITAATTHTSNLSSTLGCDSTITTTIAVISAYNADLFVDICSGASFTYDDGTISTNITTDESHISQYVSSTGCDSTITEFITVHPNYTITEDFVICENASFTYPDGFTETITSNTSHTSNLFTAAGCDSIITTNITMSTAYTGNQSLIVCSGETVTYPDGTTEVAVNNTTHTSTLVSINGCDSTIITTVQVNQSYFETNAVSVCENETVIFPDGTSQVMTADLTYNSNFTTITGCDSIIETVVTVTPMPAVDAGEDLFVCEGDLITLSGSGAANYTWDNGVVDGVPFQAMTSGTYSVTGVVGNGCSGTDEVIVVVSPYPTASFTVNNTYGCTPLTVSFTNTTPGQSYNCQWTVGNSIDFDGCGTANYTFNFTGIFDVTLAIENEFGCADTVTVTDLITVDETPDASFYTSTSTISMFDTDVDFINTTDNAVSYFWDFGDGTQSIDANPSHTYDEENNGNYLVELVAYNSMGCTDTASYVINYKEEIIYYVPNTFTPDEDANNPVFLPIFYSGYDPYDYHLTIYNRWGELVFESADVSYGWDGTYGPTNAMAQDGMYIWKIEFKTIETDARKMIDGYVNLLR